ncbi:MAG: hypothetical protein GY862_34065 [Gammaproteobacteria bacterium]|nr:hypothetical protein [Gammaproteobacteria bacterium]
MMMNQTEFDAFMEQNQAVKIVLLESARASGGKQYSVSAGEAVLLVLMFPLARFILVEIGLPWLHEAKRYSELWRQRMHQWIDAEYEKQGFDPDRAEKAAEKLREKLESTTDTGTRALWEKLAKLLTADKQG